MAIKIRRHKGLTTTYTIDGIRKRQKFFRENIDSIIRETMVDVQRRVILAMAVAYLKGKKYRTYRHNKYLSRPESKQIEYAIFGGSVERTRDALSNPSPAKARAQLSIMGILPPEKKGKGSYIVRIFPEPLSSIRRRIPHFDWVDKGIKANTDIQPYLDAKKLKPGEVWRPITKRQAQAIDREFIKEVEVRHKRIKKRDFVLAASRTLKKKSPIVNFIKKRLEEIIREKGLK